MSAVPENQKIEEILPTNFNHEFATIADSLLPELFHSKRTPVRLVRFENDASQFFKVKPVLDNELDSLPTQLWAKGSHFVLDFGLHLVGYLSFRLEAEGLNIDAPCRLRLAFGESPIDVTEDMSRVDTWISTSWLPDEIMNVGLHARACLASSPLRFSLPESGNHRYLSQVDLYNYNDPLLETIDEISILTLRDCMQTVFEDGPRRDRRLWIGDLRLQALTSYHTLRDYNLAKRCLFLFAALPRSDSSLPACLFEKPKLTPATDYIVDYDALFGVIVHDYVRATNDLSTGHALWSTVQGTLLKAISHLESDTKVFNSALTPAWKFLDWAPNLDTSAGMHGLLLYSLKSANALASLLSISPLPYTDLISKMTTAASTFLSPHPPHVFISGPDAQVSLASAAWLTLSGAFPDQTCRDALLGALSHSETIKPLTPYLFHHIIDALATVSLFSEAIALLKEYWGGMVNAGADTFWECFNSEDHRSSPYGDVRNNSFCHAWSCSPSWLLRVRMKEHLGAEVRETVSLEELERRHIRRSCGV